MVGGGRPKQYTIPLLNKSLRLLCPCCATPTTQLIIRPPPSCCPPGSVSNWNNCCMSVVDMLIYLLGPLLICLASAIILGLTYTFFYVMLPMLSGGPNTAIALRPQTVTDSAGAADANADATGITYTKTVCAHIAFVFFLLINVVHNYVLCVTTRSNGPSYDRVVRELAEATGFRYPETVAERVDCKRDYQEKLMARGRARRDMARARQRRRGEQQQPQPTQQVQMKIGAGSSGTAETAQSNTTASSQQNGNGSVSIVMGSDDQASQMQPKCTSSTAPEPEPAPPPLQLPNTPAWMLMDPTEWGYCTKSNQPKPPRSHYDHVTKCLVLNMDHYCPWVFNVVGYFNYRYFCNFLLYVWTAMIYGTVLSFQPFRNMNGPLFRQQVKLSKEAGYKTVQHMLRMVPTPDERTAITFAFMLCISIGIAVSVLGGFHLYLLLSAQTTIEFHGNFVKRRGAARRGTKWKNPYSLGWRRNWQLIYGSMHPLLAILPSSREPEFLPIPISGELSRRPSQSKKEEGLPLLSPARGEQRTVGSDVSNISGGDAADGKLNKRRTGAHEV
mmetsp:Transcript_3278/g.6379  ORF Transcript_3278/g.6379 Transcript_3278/m.6379 type:complete len:557 (+) Transcript_3278:31-1701(+)